jgi:hypothetical protein
MRVKTREDFFLGHIVCVCAITKMLLKQDLFASFAAADDATLLFFKKYIRSYRFHK